MLWLYFARRESFPFVRNMFMIAMGLALVGYMVFPTAPPRYLPEWGFTDTVSNFVGTHTANTASVLYNPYAAIPSMHVAFALMIGIPGARLTRTRWLRPLWYFYPVLVTVVVVVTANHFWIDAALGALVAAHVVLRRLLRARASPPGGLVLALQDRGRGHRLTPDTGGPPATERSPETPRGRRQRGSSGPRRGGAEMREEVRNRLIESRLTPNAISLTGFVGQRDRGRARDPALLLPRRASRSSSDR